MSERIPPEMDEADTSLPVECDDLDAFLSAVDASLTKVFGPDHQRVLSTSGKPLSAFEW